MADARSFQGPTAGGNRMRNTSNNKMSKSGGYGYGYKAPGISGGSLPTLDPSATANYFGQIQTLQASLANQLSSLKTARKGIRGTAQVARADARSEGQQALREGIGSALDRGVVGSSVDLGDRAATRAATSSAIAGVNRQLFQDLSQNRFQANEAALGFQMGVQQVEAAAIAQRMNLAAEERANAISLQIAQMQAQASNISNAAQMAMANKQLAIARDEAIGLNALVAGLANPPNGPGGNGRGRPNSSPNRPPNLDRYRT